jgi:hypothetical protein
MFSHRALFITMVSHMPAAFDKSINAANWSWIQFILISMGVRSVFLLELRSQARKPRMETGFGRFVDFSRASG